MAKLHQYDYIFAIGLLFAALDAYNIGANDVANSFATSVAARSLTMRQACMLAAVCEFLGAVLVGAKVTGTIKNGIIQLAMFRENAGIEMLAFTCALAASATWLMIATKNSWPVSTTYSIVSALAGVGVAVSGPSGVQWGWNGGKGLATIFAGMGIAPAISAGFGAVVYLITKYAVLVRKDSVKKAMLLSPIYFFTVFAVLTMSIVYKGSPSLKLDKLSKTTIALAIVLTALVGAIISIVFWLPYVYAKVVRQDYTLRPYHIFLGPLLWKRPAPEPMEGVSAVADYRVHGRAEEETPAAAHADHVHHPMAVAEIAANTVTDDCADENKTLKKETSADGSTNKEKDLEAGPSAPAAAAAPAANKEVPLAEVDKSDEIVGPWIMPRNLLIIAKRIPKRLAAGSNYDVHGAQMKDADTAARLKEMHEIADQYDNDTEHLYTYLQVLTACVNSFAHGANDVSNAVGPFSAIYYIWSEGTHLGKDTPTPTWILAFGAIFIVIGLATYGYNIMAALGNRLTLHSPSRGFSMQFGASLTVLLASQYAIPVSSTMCLAGATAGVGLMSGGPKAVNWRAFGWIVLGWVLTVPIAGTAAGCLMGLFINAPHW
ncbi:Phosphate-repressible phosphate permease pho-4 [Vanrija pseudolonga]|uniref:Phosphate transporter n=1 Tax=Vanrija pseudolonga TaxID=143232 RepID=A0AAF0YHV3_9TREE|nr:Phosphate-repressible phosphate permease pho-4 [Vanrija pseudolonga]